MQRNFDFSASFNAYYLVNPNNLLTHTHTHLAHLAFKRLHVRAREARVTLINKGLLGVPFVRIFVSLYEQKMNEITSQNMRTHEPCVPTCIRKREDAKGSKQKDARACRDARLVRPLTTVDELAVSRPLERTHGPCVPTCAMHTTRQGKQYNIHPIN